jgi:hypothetical protein
MTTQQAQAVPDGYKRNAKGDLVRTANIREQDLLRDQVALELCAEAVDIEKRMAAFKLKSRRNFIDLVEIAGERYGVQLGGTKGNVTAMAFDGSCKAQRCVASIISFTEEIHVVKALFDACIVRFSVGANPNLQIIVGDAFRTNAQGDMSTESVLKLLRYEIDDPDWRTAQQALKDSILCSGTATYFRFYERIGDTDKYRAITLDMASA